VETKRMPQKREKPMRHFFAALALVLFCFDLTFGQANAPTSTKISTEPLRTIPLSVPAGTPLPVVLDKEVRIRKVGQPIHGRIAEPVYAFDKLVVPAGSEVTGSVTRIGHVSAQKRALAALNANFSPFRDIQLDFSQLVLPVGRRVPLQTRVSPASEGVLQFAPAANMKNPASQGKKSAAGKLASRKANETRQEIHREWETAKKQVSAPGKMHRLERIAIAQLPFHPQYMDAGTRFNAELLEPLYFGKEELTPAMVQSVGTPPAPGSVIHARLLTPLSSADAERGDLVEAVMTEPLFAENQLILPAGTDLKGLVLQVRPARSLRRNGQLRIVFHEVVPPSSVSQNVEASLEGVEVKNDEHLNLDSEGGAQATTPKTRYLTTGISVALAATSLMPDADAGSSAQSVGEAGGRAANGASGFRVAGLLFGVLVHSRALASGFGVYGAGMSIYDHFLTHGRDVVYPKDTAMAIGFGSRVTGSQDTTPGI
jgi:hypothetical protein